MPTIKKITVGGTQHDLGAKYDDSGNQLSTSYVRNNNIQQVTVKTLTLTDGTSGTTTTYNLVCIPNS